MNRRNNTPAIVAAAVILLLILASAHSVMADRKRASMRLADEKQVAMPMDSVTIEKKTLTQVITNVGDEYSLSSGTIIVGLDGQQVSIRKMLVPCDAQITYKKKGNVRQAERIQITLIYPNASWHWFSKSPE